MESARRPPRSTRPTKILRIGVLLGGRLVEERLVRDHGRITIGQSARSTFVVPDEALGRETTFFEPTATGYRLVLAGGMDGFVGGSVGSASLREARAQATPRADGTVRLPLADDARGKVTIGEVTILFQLVTLPPPRPAPRLPASVRGTLGGQIDRITAGVLSGSLAVHVAFFAYLGFFVEIPRNVEPEEIWRVPVRAIPVGLKRPEQKQGGPGESKADAPKVAPPRAPRSGTPGPRVLTREERNQRDRDLAARTGIVSILTKRSADGTGGVFDGLRDGSAQSSLDAALRRLGGVRAAKATDIMGLATREGAGGGGQVKTVADLGRHVGPVGDGGRPTGVQREHRPTIKPPTVREDDTDLTDVAGVNRTLRNGYGAMKACYDRGIKHDHRLQGKLSVRISVSGAGMVTAVKTREATLGDAAAVACMTATIKAWRFPPAGSGKVAAVEATWVFKAGD
jgi:hypothetical protein